MNRVVFLGFFILIHCSLNAQDFIHDFKANASFWNIQNAFEVDEYHWVNTYWSYSNLGEFHLLNTYQSEDSIYSTSEQLSNSEYYLRYGYILQDYSNSEEIVGLANAIRIADSSELVVKWSFNEVGLNIKEIVEVNNYIQFGKLWKDCLVDDSNRIIFIVTYTDSSYVMNLFSVDQNFDVIDSSGFYFSYSSRLSFVSFINNKIYFSDFEGLIFKTTLDNLYNFDTIASKESWSAQLEFQIYSLQPSHLDSTILVNGSEVTWPANALKPVKNVHLSKLKPNGSIQQNFIYYSDTINEIPQYINYLVDLPISTNPIITESAIYHGATTYKDGSKPFFDTTASTIHIFKLNEDLEKIWQFDFTDSNEAHLNLYDILPLEDGSILAYCYRYDYKNAPNDNLDILILRIKEDGTFYSLNVQELSSTKDRYRLFPNPASNSIRITGNKENIVSYRITDMNGKTVIDQQVLTEIIAINELKNGIYFIEFTETSGNKTIQKFVVQH